jgi:hypothetical protein
VFNVIRSVEGETLNRLCENRKSSLSLYANGLANQRS